MIEEGPRPITCLCPTCDSLFAMNKTILEAMLQEKITLEGGAAHPLEELEELRLALKSFLRPEVLQALVELLGAIDRDPKHSEMFAWFSRNSSYGSTCRYALMALKKFREDRLEKVKELVARVGKELENV